MLLTLIFGPLFDHHTNHIRLHDLVWIRILSFYIMHHAYEMLPRHL